MEASVLLLVEVSGIFPRVVFSQNGEVMGDGMRWVHNVGSQKAVRVRREASALRHLWVGALAWVPVARQPVAVVGVRVAEPVERRV
ncbi:hypothetical protein A4G30_10940 [Mycobacterium kansasii]|nr:hypothetical protein A4G30_10940 [Mycobacterium kansasii]